MSRSPWSEGLGTRPESLPEAFAAVKVATLLATIQTIREVTEPSICALVATLLAKHLVDLGEARGKLALIRPDHQLLTEGLTP